MELFGTELRRWRRVRRMSQLALASDAGVSARHVSFVETARARPSRDMVLRLAEALEVPPDGRNALLEAAGYAAHYRRGPLEAEALAPVRRAMERLIARHDPYPAVVLDRLWRIVALNRCAGILFGAHGVGVGEDLLEALLAIGPNAVENWGEVGDHMRRRLRAESRAAGGLHRLDQVAARLDRDPAVAGWTGAPSTGPLIATRYRVPGGVLALFSTFTQFSGSEDAGVSELKIELMFPADAESEAALEAIAAKG
ncbi:helix-turn-helix domain-containing protein [Aestuariibius sp. 2305UL40-4]|uniref:helix-turn-helix domain-containing protein n=1 Tax=Aestuariibius violaceus TaxID=3234132 RepID=UPI00345E397A